MSFKTDAFVLRVRPWREADRVYDLFTPQEGIISAVLKSAAKSSSKLSGHLLPFAKVRVMIGRGKLDHMAGASILVHYPNLRNNLRNMSLASSVVELFLSDRNTGQKFREFSLLEHIFTILDHPAIVMEKKMILVRAFLWKYLALAGWQPRFEAGQTADSQGIMYMEHEQKTNIEISSQLFDFLQYIIGADWAELINLSIDNQLSREWLKVSQIYYQSIFERPSNSLKLFTYG
ncbi:DNA repair protein RecO [Patescibacteria group bacterium]|nr:DNA repair protein RecO [Patescibacteria group bacterium]